MTSFFSAARLWAFAAAAILGACAHSGPAIAGEAYEIDPTHSHVQFSVERFGFNDVIGFFPAVSGTVFIDPENPAASRVEAEIGTASLVSGDATRNEHVAGDFWLNTAEFPAMRFVSTVVELTSETSANVTGDLTLLGVTAPVTLAVTLNKLGTDPATKREAAGFSATATLKRSDFGMMTAMALIGDDIDIRIETLAHKKTESVAQ